MSIGNLGLYRKDGRIRGSFVYMLLCRDDGGPIYFKVGITDNLYVRMQALRRGCPVTPRYFHSFEVPHRRYALGVERALHKALNRWRAHGEWFKVLMTEKDEFNMAHSAVLDRYRTAAWPCRWEKVAVLPLIAEGDRKSRYIRRVFRRRGAAFQDYRKDLQSSR